MAFTSSLYPNERIIHDTSPHHLVAEPEGMSRGLDFSIRPYSGYDGLADSFPSNLLIDPSEYQARIQEMEERKSRLSDIVLQAGLPCKDQGQTNYSHDGQTEVLTETGWVRWPDYNWKDRLGTTNPLTGFLEFQAPTEGHAYEYDDELYHSTNRRIDFGVTRNHRMLVRKWDESKRTLSNDYSFQRADGLGWYVGLMAAPKGWIGTDLVEVEVPGDRRYDGDDFLAMLAMIVADGYAGGSESTRDWVSFCCFAEDRYPAVAALAQRIGFKEQPSRRGVWTRYGAAALAEWVRQNCYLSGQQLRSPWKKVPGIIRHTSQRQIEVFLRFFGDRSHSGQPSFFSTSQRVIDDLQELLLRVNKRSTVWKSTKFPDSVLEDGTVIHPRHPLHFLGVSETERLCLERKRHVETDHYKGLVYCATVPNGTLVTRRKGTVLISGNCWINAPTHCVEVLRVLQNQPMVILSPASAGAPIKNFSNQGGWGGEGLAWIIKNGLVPVDKWPANAIDRQYYTDANKTLALKYRVVEWMQVTPRTMPQVISLLLRRWPGAAGMSWWAHEITYYDVVWLDGGPAIRFRNSWGMAYGTQGFNILQGSKMIPDDYVSPSTVLAN